MHIVFLPTVLQGGIIRLLSELRGPHGTYLLPQKGAQAKPLPRSVIPRTLTLVTQSQTGLDLGLSHEPCQESALSH